MKPCEEMTKLRDYLNAKGIKWQDRSDDSICRTWFYLKGMRHSVVNGYGTYGGESGLLEMMISNHEPDGWLTADKIIEVLKI